MATRSMQQTAEKAVSSEKLKSFISELRGELIGRDHPHYDQIRKVHNAMIDRRPAWIARCVDVADVIACVNFARNNSIPVAVRGGGHNAAGLGLVEDGLVIDLSQMKGIRVNPDKKTVTVQGGATLGDVDHATHAFGLAMPAGIISTTGVGGLTLGGGIGYLTRKYGLSIDNMLSADVVLADSRFVTASSRENADLFWGLRGGGGNFGVATSLTFQLHPVDMVYAGPMLWPLEKAPEVMRFFQEFILKAPDNINGFFLFMNVPPGAPFPAHLHGKTLPAIVWSYTGAMDRAEKVFQPIRKFGPPILDLVGKLAFPALQSMFDAIYPPGLQMYWKADFINHLDDRLIDINVKHGSRLPTALSSTHLYPINGAAHDMDKTSTPFYYREANFAQVIVAADPEPKNAGLLKSWATDYFNEIHPHSAGGAYLNFIMDEGEDRVKAAYSGNYPRLVELKNKFDPLNLFRVNQNIKPTV